MCSYYYWIDKSLLFNRLNIHYRKMNTFQMSFHKMNVETYLLTGHGCVVEPVYFFCFLFHK